MNKKKITRLSHVVLPSERVTPPLTDSHSIFKRYGWPDSDNPSDQGVLEEAMGP